MCDWSNWKWLCDGHYEIALTILLTIASAAALITMAILAIYKKKKKADERDKAIELLRESFSRGEMTPDDFLRKCDEASTHVALSGHPETI